MLSSSFTFLPGVSSVVVVGIDEIVKIPVKYKIDIIKTPAGWFTLDHMGHSTIF